MDYNNDDSMDINNDRELSASTNDNNKTGPRSCVICGANAAGVNFSALTCIPCKAFFRRNGLKTTNLVACRSFGQCEINSKSRRQCTACRIQKCFAMGMQKERIRSEEENKRYRELVIKNRKARPKKDVGHQDGESQTSTNDFDDSSCVDNLYNLYMLTRNETIQKEFIFDFNSDLTELLNLYCAPASCLIAFMKQLSHFQSIPVDDRIILIKNNTKILLPIFICLLNLTPDTSLLANHHRNNQTINGKIAESCLLFSSIMTDDSKLLLLLITVFLFSPCLLTNKSLIETGYINNQSYQLMKQACDEYTEMLWNYIVKKSDDEEQVVLTYMKIITTVTQLQKITSEIYDGLDGLIQVDKLHLMIQSVLHLN